MNKEVVNKLVISNLPEGITQADLRDLLRGLRYESFELKPDKYALVTFEDNLDAEHAEEVLKTCLFDNCLLRVKFARW